MQFRDRRATLKRLAVVCALVWAGTAATLAEGEGFYGPLELKGSEQPLMKTVHETEDLFIRRGYRYDAPELESLVNRLASRLAPKPTDDYIHYRVHLLRDVTANAFALPDGQVYINTGLLALLENEAQIAAVLAHEVTHTAGHHGILSFRSVRRKAIGSMALGPLTLGVGDYFLARSVFGYSRELEDEADRMGAKRLVQAGYDPRQMIRMLELLADDPEGERPAAKSAKWSTHPELQARSAATRAMLPALTVGARPGSLTSGPPGWRRLTRRVSLDTANDLIEADYPRAALALARRLVSENDGDAAAHLALADARRTLGARTTIEGEAELTNKEKRRNLARRVYLTRDERQEKLLETDAGRQALRQNLDGARQSYLRALGLDPGLAEAHRGLGFTLEGLQRPREAGQEFVAYLRARPQAPDKPIIVDHLRQITDTLKRGGKP